MKGNVLSIYIHVQKNRSTWSGGEREEDKDKCPIDTRNYTRENIDIYSIDIIDRCRYSIDIIIIEIITEIY